MLFLLEHPLWVEQLYVVSSRASTVSGATLGSSWPWLAELHSGRLLHTHTHMYIHTYIRSHETRIRTLHTYTHAKTHTNTQNHENTPTANHKHKTLSDTHTHTHRHLHNCHQAILHTYSCLTNVSTPTPSIHIINLLVSVVHLSIHPSNNTYITYSTCFNSSSIHPIHAYI